MTAVRISIAGRDYDVACDDGQENHLKNLARVLDERVRALGIPVASKNAEPQGFMLAALMLTDELQEATRELNHLRYDIHYSSQSFEQNKQIELENVVASTIHTIADRIEAIAHELEEA